MAGNLIISQINGGQIGFRNILINGWVNTPYEINQRALTFAEVSDGEYFADRWKRVDASNMTQIVEEGNYKPGVEYCLSGTGVTTQVLTSPSSGNWTLPDIPSTASYIQLEEGNKPTSFEWRSVGYEMSLCQRYYQIAYGNIRFDAGYVGAIYENAVSWNTIMRVPPSIVQPTNFPPVNIIVRYLSVGTYGCRMEAVSTIAANCYALNQIVVLEAEL